MSATIPRFCEGTDGEIWTRAYHDSMAKLNIESNYDWLIRG